MCINCAHKMLQIDTEGGVEIVIPPLALPIGTEVTVAPVPVTDLSCSPFSTTRFSPFGFKEISASQVEAEQFSLPVSRVYWRIPSRFRSLKQIKFVHTSVKGMNRCPAMICEKHGMNTANFGMYL